MRRFVFFLVLFAVMLAEAFAQPKVIKETREVWNSDSGRWDTLSSEQWMYDNESRTISNLLKYGPNGNSQKFRLIENDFDNNGNLILNKFILGSDTTKEIRKYEYSYNLQNKLIEEIYSYKGHHKDSFEIIRKFVHSYFNDSKWHRTENFNWNPFIEKYYLISQQDTLYDHNGCIIETLEKRFNGSTIWGETHTMTSRDDGCRQLIFESHQKAASDSFLIPKDREIHEYFEEGKLELITYEWYQEQIGWKVAGHRRIEYDDEFREVFNHETDTSGNGFLRIDRYDEDGRHIFGKITWGDALYALLDIEYITNSKGQIVKIKDFRNLFYGALIVNKTFHYTYYCDGQIKTIVEDELPNVYRTSYEYDSRGECFLEKDLITLTVYPNPSQGKFEIESNLLIGSNAVIRIFSGTGQEVYSESITKTTERRNVDLNGIPKGFYYLSIQNGKFSASKRILITR